MLTAAVNFFYFMYIKYCQSESIREKKNISKTKTFCSSYRRLLHAMLHINQQSVIFVLTLIQFATFQTNEPSLPRCFTGILYC